MIKKITSLCLIPAMAFAYITVQIDAGAQAATTDRYFLTGDPNTANAWAQTSGGTAGAGVPGDTSDAFWDAAGNNAYTMTANITQKSMLIVTGYTATWVDAGFKNTILGAITADWGGAATLSGTWLKTGAGNIHLNAAGTATVTANFADSSGGNNLYDCDKANWRWNNFDIGAGTKLTTTGAGGSHGCYGVMTINGICSLAVDWRQVVTTSTAPLTIGPNGKLTGTATYVLFLSNGAPLTLTLPKIKEGNTANFTMRKSSGNFLCTLKLADSLVSGGNLLAYKETNSDMVFDFRNEHVQAVIVYTGTNAGGNDTTVYLWDGGTSSFVTWDGSTYNAPGAAGAIIHKIGSGVIGITGAITHGSTHQFTVTTGKIAATGSAAAVLTTGGSAHNIGNFEVNKTSNGVRQTGVAKFGTLTLTDGTFTQTVATDTVYASNATVNTTDAVTNTAPWNISNKLQIAAGLKLTLPILIIGGTPGAPDTIQSASGKDTLAFTGDQRVTANYVYIKNTVLTAGDTLDLRTGGIDGGGNEGAILFPSTGVRHRVNSGTSVSRDLILSP